MRETWYVLEDGAAGDPAMIRPGKDGVLTHKDGRKVAYGPHGPRSAGVDPEAERAAYASREMKPEAPKGGGYKTRQAKA